MNAPLLRPLASLSLAALAVLALAAAEAARAETATLIFSCREGKSITATIDDPAARLELSDGRTLTVSLTETKSGARYVSEDRQVVFFRNGRSAFINEGEGGARKRTFEACRVDGGAAAAAPAAEPEAPAGAPDLTALIPKGAGDPEPAPKGLPKGWTTYEGTGFTIGVPPKYTVDAAYRFDQLGPGKEIPGVAFAVPESMTKGRNLSPDSRVSVEQVEAGTCTADLFLPEGAAGEVKTVSDGGVEWSVATASEGAAGSTYDQSVFARVGSKPCVAVRTFIHTTNIANYDPGTVKEVNREALDRQFERMRRSLVLGKE